MTKRLAGLAVLLLFAAACTAAPGELGSSAGSGPEPSQAFGQPATSEEITAALEGGTMPNLVGWDLNELGDGTGLLYDLHGVIGIQATKSIASDTIPAGTIAAQQPAPGTALDQIDGEWALDVSDGGPVAAFDDLPSDAAKFALTLEGFDQDELMIRRSTPLGVVYKSDDWLFGLDCAAVEAAYRTFLDASYVTACPQMIGYLPAD